MRGRTATSIFADVMRYDVAPLFPRADGSRGQKSVGAYLERWTFDLGGRQRRDGHGQALDDLSTASSRGFDERVETRRPYRHGWYAARPASNGQTVKHQRHGPPRPAATGRRAGLWLLNGRRR
jgi:hypothetical protein